MVTCVPTTTRVSEEPKEPDFFTSIRNVFVMCPRFTRVDPECSTSPRYRDVGEEPRHSRTTSPPGAPAPAFLARHDGAAWVFASPLPRLRAWTSDWVIASS